MPITRLFPVFLLLFPFIARAENVTLEQAFQSAQSQSETLRQSSERVIQSEARLSRLKGGLLPNLSANATYRIQPEPADPVAREFSPGKQTTAALTATQPIFRGLREFAGIRQQKYLTAAEEAARSQALAQLFQNVATTYLNVLSLEQDLHNLTGQAEIYAKRAEELGGRSRRGESSTTEYLSAQSAYASIQAEIRLVRGQLQMARENFHFLTRLPSDATLVDPKLLGPENLGTDAQRGEGALQKYLARIENRPDIRTARENVEATDAAVSVARGAHYPSIDAVGNYYLKRPGFLSETKWDLEFRLNIPLFEGGSTQSAVRESVSLRKEAELELERLRRLATQDIRSLHESLSARLAQIDALKNSAGLSEKNAQISQRDFRRGLIRNIDVQVALSEYRSVQRTYDQARFAAQLDYLQLEIAAALRPVEIQP